MRAPMVMAVRVRLAFTISAAVGLAAVLLAVGALFPAVGHTIGKLDLPQGVSQLLGGADYATVAGWFRSEIGAVYGPLVTGAVAISSAAAVTAREEEDHILGLVLSHPIARGGLVAAKAVAVAVLVGIIAASAGIGLLVGVALAGGGVTTGNVAAYAVQLGFFGLALGSIALAAGAGTGRPGMATGVAAGVGILGWLINGFAPLVGGLDWLKYLSLFYYYAGHDPLTRGIDVGGLVVLGSVAVVLTALARAGFERRDLRA